LIAGIVGAVFGLLVLRLWSLQVIHGKRYQLLAEQNRLRTTPLPAPRGLLLDRNGHPLVTNVPVFRIEADPRLITETAENIALIARLLELPEEEIRNRLARKSDPHSKTVVLKEDIPFPLVARVEARRMEFPGLTVRLGLGRRYPYGSVGAHVLGFLGRLRPDQVGQKGYAQLPPDTQVGQSGVERLYDGVLRGTPGERIFEVSAEGSVTRVLGIRPPVRGSDLRLSLDLRTQRTAETALGNRAGAVVALDPRTGEVLALVSHPSFDPNLFVGGIPSAIWKRLKGDPAHPLFNRATQSRYPPGSIFKPVVAAAGLETGVLSPDDTVRCDGKIEVGGREFRCWEKRGHGSLALTRAMAESCDVYFYRAGLRMGIDTMAAYARSLNLDRPPNLGLSRESAGVIPSPAWKKRVIGERWYPGDTLNTSIGQGYVGISPMHAALIFSAFVNGGVVPKPRLTFTADASPSSHKVLGWRDRTFELLRAALTAAVNNERATGRNARSPWFTVAGKTGTAQVTSAPKDGQRSSGPEDHAWFVGYAPAEAPAIVVAVLVEHGGHGGSNAAPIARDVMEAFLAPVGPPPPGGQGL